MADSEALMERLFTDTLDAFELFSVYLGDRLDLYRALDELGAGTARDLAAKAGIAERYAREWLEQQAVAGFVEVENAEATDTERRYHLPPEHRATLVDLDSPTYFAAGAPAAVGLAQVLDDVVEAYRTGGGVPYADYGRNVRDGIGLMNRPMFVNELTSDWLTAVPEVDRRLRGGGATVADLACGTGWSTIALARAYPDITVDGYDLDEASVEVAREHARQAGVADRVAFHVADATRLDAGPGYDAVLLFEGLHDMADPVAALAGMRRLAGDDGVVIVADERVADRFSAPGDEVERFMYGWSVLHCLPATMAEQPRIAHGTVLRHATLDAWAHEAGFDGAEVLPIDNDFWRFYRLQ